MNIIDIVLAENHNASHFVEVERSDTHAGIGLSYTVHQEGDIVPISERRLHVGLVDIIAHAPVIATYEELPENGIVALVRKDNTVGNIVPFHKLGGVRLYEWFFDKEPFTSDHEQVRLLHGDTPLALPSTEEQS